MPVAVPEVELFLKLSVMYKAVKVQGSEMVPRARPSVSEGFVSYPYTVQEGDIQVICPQAN